MFPFMFVQDVARSGTSVIWWLPPVNGLFPDLVATAIGYAAHLAFRENSLLVYAVFCAFTFLTGYALLRAGGIETLPAAAASLAAFAAFAWLEPRPTLLTTTLLSPDSHQGSIGFALAGAALYLQLVGRRRPRAAALALVVALGVFADRLLLLQLAAPLAILALASSRTERGREQVRALGALAVGVLGGLLATAIVERSGPFHIGVAMQIGHYRFGRHALGELIANLGTVFGTAHALGFALAYLALLALAFVKGRGNRYSDLLAVGIALSTAALVAPIVSLMWVDVTAIRYQLPAFLIPGLIIVAVALNELAGRARSAFAVSLPAFVIVLVVASAGVVNASGVRHMRTPGDATFGDVTALAGALEREAPPAVLAEYWLAKPLLLVSDGRLKTCEIDDAGNVFPWITDLNWCLGAYRALARAAAPIPVVDYGNRIDVNALEQRFGAPSRVATLAGYRVLYFPPARAKVAVHASLCSALRASGHEQDLSAC